MPLNPLKEFFKKKKSEIKFARAGPGQKLSQDTPAPSSSTSEQSARQAAAEAAMKRYSKDQSKPSQRPRMATTDQQSRGPSDSIADSNLSKVVPLETEPKIAQKELPIIDGVAQRSVQIYSTEELAQRIKQPDIDDDFFRLTVEDVKLLQQRYTEERARNEILKTSEMRRREAESKKPTTNIARLRFRLPSNFVVEASFSGNETLDFVRDWLVATCLENFHTQLDNFDILIGVKPVKPDDMGKSLRHLNLLPATTLSIMMKNS